ncbi:uncharacterized protein LOC130825589 isoform X2 [Amaranthus tricolor]|uniref:uncharacterized protein LOC130825589 isoform X2 n=1 Tax=Amaranthus tricolor TaxID=29722 RepID=UPI00258BB973|nr:uncharacterized protein LOC130825589 isoform X2 [Amaranthus tricolor]XP_057546878.1 uncharacterized protein LOC130825589 isoform X2 [Amaranthus tricolor]XP_057546879.1 uncharacterized protein LOC130825589 isoform X2 [Amaranthus tricolor]
MGEMTPLRPAGYIDPGWEHGTAQDEKKKKVKCNYCGKVVSGGIYRLKQHLARVSGEVTYCERAPEDVYLKMRENLEGCRSNKKQKLSENDEQAYLNFQSHDDDDDDDAMETMEYKRKGKKVMNDKSFFLNLTPLRSLGYVDPGWEHGIAQDERKKKVKCNYCGKIVSGGINRFKQHLARIPGEVAPCKNAPDEVYLKIKDNMKWHRTGRRHRRPNTKEAPTFFMHSDNEPEEDEPEDVLHHLSNDKVVIGDMRQSKDFRRGHGGISSGSSSEMYLKKSRLNSSVLKTSMRHMPLTYKQGSCGSNKKNRKEVLSAISEFFYYAGIPMQVANSLSFQKMLELVGHYGPGLTGPSSRQISGRFLHDELSTVKSYLVEYRTCWAVTGCSIMADSWKNSQGRILINFLVSCPRGVYFVYLVDATDVVDDPSSLFKLLDQVVEEIGEENVVQVVTQNTPNYKAAGKMLEDKRKTLFWTPCVAYSIDRVLEDFLKIKIVGECIEKAQKVTKFIYNRTWLLNLMKKEFTGRQDILRPAITKYAANFISLQGVFDHRISLKRMFQSSKWLLCRYSRSEEGKEVEKIVLNASFWKKMQHVLKSVEPVLQALHKVDSNSNLSLPYVYSDLLRAKLAIKSMHGEDADKYGPFWSVIDSHLSSLFHHSLCVAAYSLNPAYRYRPDYQANPEVVRGLNECIVRLESDRGRQVAASMQISDFVSAKADFGTELAISTRTELDPGVWWQQHGINCLELQCLAVRILSQTCSSFGCEHNWSVYDQIHCESQNNLARKKLTDFVYVHYNLRLRERQIRQANELMSLDSALLEGLLDDWVVEAGRHAIQDDEDIFDHEDGYNYDILDYDDGNSDMRRGSLEMVTLADVEPLEVHPNAGPATDDDADLDFLDDDLTD